MRSYRAITSLLSPLLPLWLYWRCFRGKEDAGRLKERFGRPSAARPHGTLLWLHAASVGEAMSVLLLIGKIRERFPQLHLLLTTGTVTSARLMQSRLPLGAVHQYAPVDTPAATRRFIAHWRPDLAFWVESELWPNLVTAANEAEAFMGIINGRMSERSFQGWQKRPKLIRAMLRCFNVVFAQTPQDAERFETLGAAEPLCVGNLKYDAARLPCDEEEWLRLQQMIGDRPLWLAASTHPGEERMIARAHTLIATVFPGLLTIIAPRHPGRGASILAELRGYAPAALRSRVKTVAPQTGIYIADTLGELGLFYRLCDIVFMGGSLAPQGGQNPLEPARLSCAVLAGPYTHNFAAMYQDMEQSGACLRVRDAGELAAQAERLLQDAEARRRLQAAAKQWLEHKSGAADRLLDLLAPLLAAEAEP